MPNAHKNGFLSSKYCWHIKEISASGDEQIKFLYYVFLIKTKLFFFYFIIISIVFVTYIVPFLYNIQKCITIVYITTVITRLTPLI